jgi:apolipoprotein N-acyltransferase
MGDPEVEGPVTGSETIRTPGWSRGLPWLALAAILTVFANGRYTIAIAAWLAPLFLLRFVRSQRAGRGLAIAWILLTGAWAFQFWGMAPVPGIFYFVLAAAYGLTVWIPFALDRILTPRVRGLAATFVLPTGWVATEYLVATFTPYGSWGSAAYSQNDLALLQIVSVTGLFGVSFLIAWFASVANWAWEREFQWLEVRRGVLAYGTVLSITLILGGARLSLFAPTGSTVRIASLTKPDIDLLVSPEVAQAAMSGTATAEQLEEIRRRAGRINDDLLRRTDREARAGAKIVFWGETNGFVFKEDEPALMRRAAELARARKVYVGLGVGTWSTGAPKPLENKLVLFDPEGRVVWENWKAIPVPGGEAAISAQNDGRIRTADTPYGRVGGVICFDMDFPRLLEQAGRANTDIMLVPSNDWREIDPWHSHMARFRAIEQGFNLVRHASNGLSIATDYQGHVLDSMDHYTAQDRVLVSRVPVSGAVTIYSRIGDVFSWLCLAGLVALSAVAWARPARPARVETGSEGLPTT